MFSIPSDLGHENCNFEISSYAIQNGKDKQSNKFCKAFCKNGILICSWNYRLVEPLCQCVEFSKS